MSLAGERSPNENGRYSFHFVQGASFRESSVWSSFFDGHTWTDSQHPFVNDTPLWAQPPPLELKESPQRKSAIDLFFQCPRLASGDSLPRSGARRAEHRPPHPPHPPLPPHPRAFLRLPLQPVPRRPLPTTSPLPSIAISSGSPVFPSPPPSPTSPPLFHPLSPPKELPSMNLSLRYVSPPTNGPKPRSCSLCPALRRNWRDCV